MIIYFSFKEGRDGEVIISSFVEDKAVNIMPRVLADFASTVWRVAIGIRAISDYGGI
jgi:hypothetical protein